MKTKTKTQVNKESKQTERKRLENRKYVNGRNNTQTHRKEEKLRRKNTLDGRKKKYSRL